MSRVQRKSFLIQDPNEDRLEVVSSAVVDLHYWIFLAQAVGFGLLFLIWQVSELQQPWYRGPWHFAFLGWLVIYGCYLSYASRQHEITSAATDARASDLPDAEKLVVWYERVKPDTRLPPWWLRFPLFVILSVLWPLLVVWGAVVGSYRIVLNPQSWPEAAAFVAAIIAILIVPTFGAGPLLVLAAHVAAVIWLRRKLV